MADINKRTGEPLRNERIFIHATFQEKATLFAMAEMAGYPSLSQYVREVALAGDEGITPAAGTNLKWEAVAAVQRIAKQVENISYEMQRGRQPDEELLLVAMQIQEVAEETLNELKVAKDAA